MRKKPIIVLFFFCLSSCLSFVSCSPPGEGAVILEFTETDGDSLWGRNTGGNMVDCGQSFRISENVECSRASIWLLNPIGNPTGDYSVGIVTDNSGVPSNDLATPGSYGTLADASLAAGQWNDWEFFSPAVLQADTTYWIVCVTDEPSAAVNGFTVANSYQNGYTNGIRVSRLNQGGWSQHPTHDMCFRLYR